MAVRGAMLDSAGFIRRSNPTRAAHSAAYLKQIAQNQGDAIFAVDETLGRRINTINNPYSAAIAANSYPTTLGDGSFWGEVGKVFAGGISAGLAQRIGGGPPQTTYVQQVAPPPPAGMPTWAKFAIGGGALLGVLLLVKKA